MATMHNKMINPRPPRMSDHVIGSVSYSTFIKRLGVAIKTHREQSGITQRELGSDINKTVTHISAVENGRRGLSLHSLFLIAQSLNINLSQLIKESLKQ